MNIYKQLSNLGLTKEFPGIQCFYEIANRFVKEGIGASGVIPLEETRRNLVYKLATKVHSVSDVILKSW
jgi:hypothetical protein